MKKWLKEKFNQLSGRTKINFKLFEGKYKIVPAFKHNGIQYYMFEDPLNILTGRGLQSMLFYEELLMRCSTDYLKWHVEAKKKLYSDPKKINLSKIMQLDRQLEERVNMLVAIPDHVWKLASVVFFDESESPYMFDQKAAKLKIERWKEDGNVKDFFYSTPLKVLIPSLQWPEQDSKEYLEVMEKINDLHFNTLSEIISKTLSKNSI